MKRFIDTNVFIYSATNMVTYGIDFVNISVMSKVGINEVHSNDKKHLGKIKFLKLAFR